MQKPLIYKLNIFVPGGRKWPPKNLLDILQMFNYD